jgi:predicted GTPase
MDFKHSTNFQEYDAILKKMLEHFRDHEQEKNVEIMFEKIDDFHFKINEIQDFENAINSHTRPLRVGFVGGFSTGKSSMINSLLGEEILGVKLEPATSQITELSYGDKFEVLEVTQDEDSYLTYNEISLLEYQKRSTNRNKRSKNLSHYSIKYPSQNLARFTITDTPGFSSTSKEDDELTKNWIKKLDLLVWIFDANKVGDKKEYDKLKELCSDTKVIGVINKIDTKSPGVREKIRSEILNEQLLEEVFFYSSKKVLGEFSNQKSFNEILNNIKIEIENGIVNQEEFEIKKTDNELVFQTTTLTKPFEIALTKKTNYTEYHESLIEKIDNVRNKEINSILNQNLINKNRELRNFIKNELLQFQDVLTSDVNDYDNWIKENKNLIEESTVLYNILIEDFDTKTKAGFKVFYTSFFKKLGSFLFYKHIDKGVFSNDLIICMKDLNDENLKNSLTKLITKEFNSYLYDCLNIYKKVIQDSAFYQYSKVDEIRNDKYHLIKTLVDGLVSSSVDAITGYYMNFDNYKIDSYNEALKYHENNIDLVVPDELLQNSICNLLVYDLIDAKNEYYLTSLESEIERAETLKSSTSEIIKLIDNLSSKLN